MSKRTSRTYDKEFKLSAELGIPHATLATWVDSHKKAGIEAFPGKGYLKPSDAEVAQLRKELAIAREERDILKKLWVSSPQHANEI